MSGWIRRVCRWAFFDGSQRAVSPIACDPGANLVLHSDGIAEALDPEGGAYDEA